MRIHINGKDIGLNISMKDTVEFVSLGDTKFRICMTPDSKLRVSIDPENSVQIEPFAPNSVAIGWGKRR